MVEHINLIVKNSQNSINIIIISLFIKFKSESRIVHLYELYAFMQMLTALDTERITRQ